MEQRASKRSSTALAGHLHNSTSRSQSQPFLKPSPALELGACVDEMDAAQSSSPDYITGEKQGMQAGQREEGGKLEGWTQKHAGGRERQDLRSRGKAQCSVLLSPGG